MAGWFCKHCGQKNHYRATHCAGCGMPKAECEEGCGTQAVPEAVRIIAVYNFVEAIRDKLCPDCLGVVVRAFADLAQKQTEKGGETE